MFRSFPKIPEVNIESFIASCNMGKLSSDQFYQAFKEMGIEYGLSFKGFVKGYLGEDQLFARLALPESLRDSHGSYFFHPSLIDSSMQAAMAMVMGTGDLNSAQPVSLQGIEIFHHCPVSVWAHIRYSSEGKALNEGKAVNKGKKLDLDLVWDR